MSGASPGQTRASPPNIDQDGMTGVTTTITTATTTDMLPPLATSTGAAGGETTNNNQHVLMTPKIKTEPGEGGDETQVTELRRPVLQRSSVGRSASPQLDSPGSNYPLTFANSISAGSSNNTAEVTGGSSVDNSAMNDSNGSEEESRVSAYARLDFESFTFYVQTLQVILGRRAENGSGMVDVHLGPAKAISRRHAKIFYNFGTQRFELSVLGRNGAFVGDVFVETDSTVPLTDGTKIQIGQIPFTFVLPSVPSDDNSATAAPSPTAQKQTTTESATTATAGVESTSPNIDPAFSNELVNEELTQPVQVPVSQQPASLKPKKQPRREFLPEEIPEEYREKPPHSYSHLIATALRSKDPVNGMSLSEIYKAIQDIYPYYYYCPHGWQNSVRHNLSSNKAFKKIQKEGKGWLWGIDEEYFIEKERQKKRALEKKANASANSQRASTQSRSNSVFQANHPPPVVSHQTPIAPELETPIKKEREKTIAELAREIEIQRQGTHHYHPTSSNLNEEKHQDDDKKISNANVNVDNTQNDTNAANHLFDVETTNLFEHQPDGNDHSASVNHADLDAVLNSPHDFSVSTASSTHQQPQTQSQHTNLEAAAYNHGPPIAPKISSGGTRLANIKPALQPQQQQSTPRVQPSLAAGQNTFRMVKPNTAKSVSRGESASPPPHNPSVPHMRVQPQQASKHQEPKTSAKGTGGSKSKPSGVAQAMEAAGIKLNPSTIKTLSAFQQKLQESMRGNTQTLTQTLALAIAQAAKESGGGPQQIASMLNSKTPSELITLLTKSLAAVKNKQGAGGSIGQAKSSPSTSKPTSATPEAVSSTSPPPAASSQSQPATSSSPPQGVGQETLNSSVKQALQETTKAQSPQSESQQQSPPQQQPASTSSTSSAQPSATQDQGKAPAANKLGKLSASLENIQQMIDKASKIPNPSPEILNAIKQLKDHAEKLKANRNKRQSEEPVEDLDSSSTKIIKKEETTN